MTRYFSAFRLATLTAATCSLAELGGCQSSHAAPATSTSVTHVLSAAEQKALSPPQVIADLKAGNHRFVAGQETRFDYKAQVAKTANGQYPKAVVLSCLDSRVPPEIVFDQGIGDLFVGRVAGNFQNTDLLGSMEFGTALAGAKAIVVLGHSNCGAIKGAIDNAQLGNLTATLANIKPALAAATAASPQSPHNTKDHDFVQAVAVENVRQTVRDITARSEVLRDRVAKGDLIVVGAMYDLNTGAIQWLD